MRTLRPYLAALGVLLIAVVARLILDAIAPGRLPFLAMFPTVLVAGYLFGAGPGLLVLILSSLAPFWVWPNESDFTKFTAVIGFLLFGGLNLWIVLRLKAAYQRLEAQDRRLEMLNDELRHRIRNFCGVTTAIVRTTFRNDYGDNDLEQVLLERIQAVASAQDLLTTVTASSDVDISEILEAIVRPLSPSRERLIAEGSAARLPRAVLTGFALILHELATNALKYGAWSAASGRVEAHWRSEGGRLAAFDWVERDGPPVAEMKREGAGMKLIAHGLPHGTVSHRFEADGVTCRIEIR